MGSFPTIADHTLLSCTVEPGATVTVAPGFTTSNGPLGDAPVTVSVVGPNFRASVTYPS